MEPLLGGRRRMDRVLDPAFITDVRELSGEDLRSRRAMAIAEGEDLSYIRRMLQGRRDMLEAELERRGSGEARPLYVQLSDQDSPGRSSRHQRMSVPPERVGEHGRQAEALLARTGLVDIEAATDAELQDAVTRLAAEERGVSQVRAAVHEVVDDLTQELGRRYREGELGPETALQLPD